MQHGAVTRISIPVAFDDDFIQDIINKPITRHPEESR